MSEHIAPEQSLALIALAVDDPERLRAQQHAQACSSCRALLDEAEGMLGWVDDVAHLPAIDPALKARIKLQVLSTPDAKPQRVLSSWWLALGLLVSSVFAFLTGEPGALSSAVGTHCMMFENLIAVGPFALAAYLGAKGRIALEPLNLACASMAGALAGQVLLHFRCPTHATPHLFAFHVVGVVLAAALAYSATFAFQRVRAR